MGSQSRDGRSNVGQVGLVIRTYRSRNCDYVSVAFLYCAAYSELSTVESGQRERLHVGFQILNVAFEKSVDHRLVRVNPDDGQSSRGEHARRGQSYIAKADYANPNIDERLRRFSH